jgi:hypothetical protein
MKVTGLISPNFSEDTLEDVYKVFPPGIRIEGRTLKLEKYIDDEFRRAELMLADLVRDLARHPLDFLMVTGELFLSTKRRARTWTFSTWSRPSLRFLLPRC